MNTHATVFGANSIFALATRRRSAAALRTAADGRGRNRFAVLVLLLLILLTLRILRPERGVARCAALRRGGVRDALAVRWARRAPTLSGSFARDPSPWQGRSSQGSYPQCAQLFVHHSGELGGWLVIASGMAAAYAAVRKPG